MEINKKQIIYFLLVLIWMIIVFVFSSEPAEKSSKTSGGLTEKIVRIITKDAQTIPQEEKDLIETIIRKCAHFGLYFIGGILITNFINTTKLQDKYILLYSILFILMYAVSDEVHQLFVPGRSGEIRDVLIDTMGGSVGTTAFYIFIKKIRRK